MRDRGQELVITTATFKQDKCEAIVAMPPSYNFMPEMISFVRGSLGIKKPFDLIGVSGFSKRFPRESGVISEAIKLAIEKHLVKKVVIFQHVDFHCDGKSSRFKKQVEEDYYHKQGLLDSAERLKNLYPDVSVTLVYARLVKDQSEIEFSKIYEDGSEEVYQRTPYLFKGINKCEVTVVQCLDYRFRAAIRACVRDDLGISHFNVIGLPGSAKAFLEDRTTAWKAVRVAHEHHGCRSFIIVHHEDCGAYEGSSNFSNVITEEDFHRQELSKMREKLMDKYPDVEVTLIYIRLTNNKSKMQFVIVE